MVKICEIQLGQSENMSAMSFVIVNGMTLLFLEHLVDPIARICSKSQCIEKSNIDDITEES